MLLWSLGAADLPDADALDLSARLQAASAEVRSLRNGRSRIDGIEVDPEWINHHPWTISEGAP